MKDLTKVVLVLAGVYVVSRVMKGMKKESADESANFVNSTGDGGSFAYNDSPWSESVNAAGSDKCMCRGVIMPCKYCGHGVGRPVNR